MKEEGFVDTRSKIVLVCDSVKEMLCEKNKRYGDSALSPLKIFSKAEADNSICIRLDDKLKRIQNSSELRKNDVADIIGYLVLLCCDKEWLSFKDLID